MTDPAITQWTEPHLAMRDASVSPTGQLFVFFPGSTFVPSDYQLLLKTAAHQGYLTIGLRYPNDWNAGGLVDAGDPNCTERARLEMFDGVDRTQNFSVGPTDSIHHRLVALLEYLDRAHPGEGWGAFLSSGEPVWTSIVIAGHSLGSGEAALIGLRYSTARVLMFSGPQDHCSGSGSVASPWVRAPGMTPTMKFFGFAHLEDPVEPLQLSAWSQLDIDRFGMPAASVNVDIHNPPYENAHELKTDALPATGSYADPHAHRSTAVDADTPRSGGVPVFDPVWRYMMGP
jgi:hypothetical protein